MDENPVGTPNPLNPTPPTEPTNEQPVAESVQPVEPVASQPVEPIISGATETVTESVTTEPVAESVTTETVAETAVETVTTPVAETVVAESVTVGPAVVEPTTVEPTTTPKEKSKKPVLIAVIIIAILAVVGAAVAAIVFLKPFASHDAVPAAIAKLFSADAPRNVTMEGSITMHDSNEEASFSSMLINFSSNVNKTGENLVSATINTTLPGENVFAFDVSEIHTTGDDLYLKLSGVSEALKNFTANQPTVQSFSETDCVSDGSGSTDCAAVEVDTSAVSVLGFLDVFDVIDDEWIRIPSSEFSNLTSLVPNNGLTTCVISAADKLGEYGNNFASLYNANQFIEYSTANLGVSKKKDTLYRLSFNAEKLTAFINSMNNSGFMNELLACTGGVATNKAATVDEISSLVNALPTFYVEINDNNDFTRLYVTFASEDGLTEASADISFSYPETAAKIEEPEYYINLSDLLTQLLSGFYGVDITDPGIIEIEEEIAY